MLCGAEYVPETTEKTGVAAIGCVAGVTVTFPATYTNEYFVDTAPEQLVAGKVPAGLVGV
jgi:hypothetical protein